MLSEIDISQLQESIVNIQMQLDEINKKLIRDRDDENAERIVVYASTRNQYDKMEIAAKSLLLTNTIDTVYFLTEDDIYPNMLPSCIKTINVSGYKYFEKTGPNYDSRWTWMPLMKLALHRILPNHDKVLWLDTDTLVVGDISKLFLKNLNGYYYAAVPETNIQIEYRYVGVSYPQNTYIIRSFPQFVRGEYFNSGCLMCNLKALRNGKGDELINKLNIEKYYFPDQDVINMSCRGRILSLPSEYNSAHYTEQTDEPKILHLSNCDGHPKYKNILEKYGNVDWGWVFDRNAAKNISCDVLKKHPETKKEEDE